MRRTSSLIVLPRRIPALSALLEDLGNPSSAAVAKALGVHVSTVERWRREERAPRTALIALFFTTTWGRSAVNCQAENDASLYFGYAAALRTELDAANAKLARLGQIGEFGSANDPAQGVKTPLQSPPPRPERARKKTRSQVRAELAEKRLAERASGPPRPFDFLRTG